MRISIAGAVESFPTTDPERPLLILDEPTLGLLRLLGSSEVKAADEWWLTPTDGAAEALIGALRGSPFDSASVISAVDRTRSLSTDPVALGIIGALSLGFVATGLFALVGLTVSAAVSARQRRTEFALLRALGLSGRQLSNSLWLENGSLVAGQPGGRDGPGPAHRLGGAAVRDGHAAGGHARAARPRARALGRTSSCSTSAARWRSASRCSSSAPSCAGWASGSILRMGED